MLAGQEADARFKDLIAEPGQALIVSRLELPVPYGTISFDRPLKIFGREAVVLRQDRRIDELYEPVEPGPYVAIGCRPSLQITWSGEGRGHRGPTASGG